MNWKVAISDIDDDDKYPGATIKGKITEDENPGYPGSIPVAKIAAKYVPSTVGDYAVPGTGLPGEYGWEYDVPTGCIRYHWDYYWDGVQYKGWFFRDGFSYHNSYFDHVDLFSHLDSGITPRIRDFYIHGSTK
jgi:hypothetical protein